jgi:hypothetical protein
MKQTRLAIVLTLLLGALPVFAQTPDDPNASTETADVPPPVDTAYVPEEPQTAPDTTQEITPEPEPSPEPTDVAPEPEPEPTDVAQEPEPASEPTAETPPDTSNTDSATTEPTPPETDATAAASDTKTDTAKDGDKLTGTLSDEDPVNQTEAKAKDKQLFGSDEADPEDDDDMAPLISDYNLKFEFNTKVVFADKLTGIPYMEINYSTRVDSPISIGTKKNTASVKPEFTAEVTGTLSNNELYSCQLEITMQDAELQIVTRHNKIEEKDDVPGKSELAVQLKFKKKPQEDWVSNCLATDGSKMKTQGDSEAYNAMAIDAITPDLSGVLFEDYDPGDSASIDLYAEPTELDDLDINNFITITGAGTLAIDYASGSGGPPP